MGGYTCPHFSLQLNQQLQKSGCCGQTMGDDYMPVCALTKTLCVGVVQCPRIDVKTKSELVKKWREDLQNQKSQPDIAKLLKDDSK